MMSASKREAPVRRAGFVALLSAGIPSVLLGLVSAITLAAAGTISIQILGGNTWGEADRDLVCLGSANDWTLGSCDALRDEPMALITPKDWLIDLFGTILEPLGVATLLLVGLGLLALLVVMVFTAASLIRTWGRKRVPRRVTDYVPLLVIGRVFPRVSGVSERLGPALSRLLRRANSAASTVVLVLLSFIIAGTTLVSWLIKPVGEMSLIEPLLGLFGPGFSGVMATILATGLVAARFLPGELTSTTGGALGPLRSGLDIVGDVANYIRPHPTSPRFGIVARYRALIDRITTMPHADGEVGYAGIVIVSHSQGSVYTAATLFGDRHREPAIYPLDVMGEDGPASRLAEMQGVAMLTCGSPIQQTYDRFFAGQYADWISRRGGDLAPLSTAWINAYRPGDYVGRAIHADPLIQPAVLVPGAGPVLIDGDESEIVEYCLDSPGSHTGYWNERDIALLANHLIERVAGEVDPLPILPRSGGGN